MTTEQIKRAEASYRRAIHRVEQARYERNRTLALALEDGWTHAQLAEALEVSRGRIGQIAMVIHAGGTPT